MGTLLTTSLLKSIDKHEFDVEAAVGIDCASVARHQGQFVLESRRADESVVHSSAGDAERAQPCQQFGGGVITEKTRRGKAVCDETGDPPPGSFAPAVATG